MNNGSGGVKGREGGKRAIRDRRIRIGLDLKGSAVDGEENERWENDYE